MTIKSSFGAVNLDVNPGAHPSAAVLEPETPFRILLFGDFSGRAAQAAQSSTGWKPVEVDRDNFEEVLAGVSPGFSGMRFRELDDFHPDRIYQQNRLFQALREVRRKLEQPATFGEAAAEIRAWAQEQAPPTATVRKAPRPAERGVSLLDSIVEAAEPRAPSSVTRRGATTLSTKRCRP